MLVKAQIPIGQVILFVVDGSAAFVRNGDAASIEVAADISALLDKVGLKGPKLAASKGDEEGLARKLTAELKSARGQGQGCSRGSADSSRRAYGDREDATEFGESGSAEEG